MAALRALALIYDIRGFTAASKRLKTADLGAFATGAHRVILDLFSAQPPTFVKNLGDGHLLLWECAQGLEPALVSGVVEGAHKARLAFAAFAGAQRAAGVDLPGKVGIGVAYGEVSRSDDYYGRALNLASRLQNEARPEGLALDTNVFEAMAHQADSLRARFKRARVRLKGLGSTVVWVDRPFSWRRALAPVAKIAALLVLPVAYVALCDAGLALPGGAFVRRQIDAREWSLLRPVTADGDVRQTAERQRRRLAQALLANRTPTGWLYGSFPPADLRPDQREADAERQAAEERTPDLWSLMQATYALLRAPHVDRATFERDLGPLLEVPFAPGRLVEHEGKAWGWRPQADADYTAAEPTLWAVAALARALARRDLLEGEARARVKAHLARAQEAALVFRPLDTGAWNRLPQQELVRRHSPYVTTLALLALLETKAAGEPWQGSAETLERLIGETARFLVKSYEAAVLPPGWRRTAEPSDKVSLGLTMQTLATLLRAEAEAGVSLPDVLLRGIPDALVERAEAQAADDYDMGEYDVFFTAHDGRKHKATEGINFLSHPWAIECAARWLERARRRGGDAADVVRVRRALGQLVVEHGEVAVTKALGGYLFVASETLIGLSSIAPPEPP